MPGINPSTFATSYAGTLASVASTVATSPQTTSEPDGVRGDGSPAALP